MSNFWPEVVEAFEALAYIAKSANPGRMEMCFTNSMKHKRSKNLNKLKRLLEKSAPSSTSARCHIARRLSRVFDVWWKEYNEPEHSRLGLPFKLIPHKEKEGVNIYIFTNGVWQPGPGPLCGLEKTIKAIIDKLDKKGVEAYHVGIQFVCFGNDPEGIKRLKILDCGLQRFGIFKLVSLSVNSCDLY